MTHGRWWESRGVSAGNLRRDLKDHDLGREIDDLLRPGIPGLLISNANND